MTNVPDVPARLQPDPDRVAEITEVYRAMGVTPESDLVFPGAVTRQERLVVTPLLSNNTAF